MRRYPRQGRGTTQGLFPRRGQEARESAGSFQAGALRLPRSVAQCASCREQREPADSGSQKLTRRNPLDLERFVSVVVVNVPDALGRDLLRCVREGREAIECGHAPLVRRQPSVGHANSRVDCLGVHAEWVLCPGRVEHGSHRSEQALDGRTQLRPRCQLDSHPLTPSRPSRARNGRPQRWLAPAPTQRRLRAAIAPI